MSDSHYRQECEHGVVLAQCKCAIISGTERRWLEIVRPCPSQGAHLGMTVVHPLPPSHWSDCAWNSTDPALPSGPCDCGGRQAQEPAESPQEPLEGASGGPGKGEEGSEDSQGDLSGAFKQCVFRSCGWAAPEPRTLLGMVALPQDIRAHLRTHRVEIELMARMIEERG